MACQACVFRDRCTLDSYKCLRAHQSHAVVFVFDVVVRVETRQTEGIVGMMALVGRYCECRVIGGRMEGRMTTEDTYMMC